MDIPNIKSDFKEWAKGFSGMDGGNLKAPLWFCGIEPGGNNFSFTIKKEYCYTNEAGENIPCWNDKFKSANSGKNGYTTWPYNQKVAKVVCQYLE